MNKIRPNDIVRHIPSGEKWIVCGVSYEQDELVPCGYPFPSLAKISDCELIEARGLPQTEEMRKALMKEGFVGLVDGVYVGVDFAGGRDMPAVVDGIQLQAKNAADRLSRDDELMSMMFENCGGCGHIIMATLLHSEEIRLLRMIENGELVLATAGGAADGAP